MPAPMQSRFATPEKFPPLNPQHESPAPMKSTPLPSVSFYSHTRGHATDPEKPGLPVEWHSRITDPIAGGILICGAHTYRKDADDSARINAEGYNKMHKLES